jgi:hypothetical protein
MPKGLRQVALSISRLSPIARWPDALSARKMASLIFLPERRFFAFTSFQSLSRPSLSFGSSSLISRRRQSLALSRARFRPPGNIHKPSRVRLTRSTRPRFDATSFEDLAMRPLVDTESAMILTQILVKTRSALHTKGYLKIGVRPLFRSFLGSHDEPAQLILPDLELCDCGQPRPLSCSRLRHSRARN